MLIPTDKYADINEDEIKSRCKISTKGNHTAHYIAYNNNTEIAFVSLDINKNMDFLVLYELLVPVKKRNKGYGSFTLREIEKLAINMGFKRIVLSPKPFENGISKNDLINWYKSRDYINVENGTGEMEKTLCY